VRVNYQDDDIAAAAQFPGQDPATTTVFNNFGMAVGHDIAISSTLVNSFRYGMTAIDTGTIGTLNSNFTTFRFISSLDPYSATTTRRHPRITP
jgi:hypothetical protein